MRPDEAEAFRRATGVSRETLERFEAYAELLRRWQARINLVGPKTLDEVWTRHFLDSAQLFPLLPTPCQVLVDLGSGAGFPGLALAILGVPEVHLIESDQRKAAFLREAARITGAPAAVHATRIDSAPAITADAVTARALAPLADLLPGAHCFTGNTGIALFPKGQNVEQELTAATKYWTMEVERLASRTDPKGVILRLRDIRPRAAPDDHPPSALRPQMRPS